MMKVLRNRLNSMLAGHQKLPNESTTERRSVSSLVFSPIHAAANLILQNIVQSNVFYPKTWSDNFCGKF